MPTTYIKIPELPAGVMLTGIEPFETVQAGVSVQIPSRYFALSTDEFILLAANGLLPNSRGLAAGSGISLVDAGAGGTLTINATGIAVSDAQFVLLAPNAALPNERVLTGTANQVIITDNGAGSTVVLSLPQSIATTSSPTFAGLTLTTPLDVPSGGTGVATLTGLVQGNGSSDFTAITNSSTVGQVLRVTGAATYAWGALDLADSDAITGILPVVNGGTGADTLTGVLQGNGASPVTAITNSSTVGQVLRVTGAATYAWGALDLADADAVTGVLGIANGGTSFSTYTLGDIIYSSATNTLAKLAGNTTTAQQFLSQTGNGATSAAPVWSALPGSFTGFANPTASVGLAAVNGAATTAMRSDAAPALSEAIVPTWTGIHTFANEVLIRENASTASDIFFINTNAPANTIIWRLRDSSAGQFQLTALNDARTLGTQAFTVDRSVQNVTTLTFGNATSNPTFIFAGTGQVLAPNGSAASPTYSFSSDTDTGVYFPSANAVRMAAGGQNIATFSYTGVIGVVGFENAGTTASAPAAGGAGALPATPAGYLTVTINGVQQQLAYY